MPDFSPDFSERPDRSEPSVLSGQGDVRIQPLAAPVAIADRLKAIGFVALTGSLGVGVVWLGRTFGNPEETLAPIAETSTGNREQSSLRDRIGVISLNAAPISPPESLPVPAAALPQMPLRQPPASAIPLTSHGFANAAPTLPAVQPTAMTLYLGRG